MSGPEKPFSCLKSGCGESFTNEDRLAVHAKKHDMELQLGPKGEVFVADQTPTPTRFIRNCEEVGLFQDLQNVNPFEETFKRAIESRTGTHNLNLDNLTVPNPDDTLHTPHIFPNLPEDNGTVIYSVNADTDRPSLGQRPSSDETNNQLSVVRCLTSSLDTVLPQICIDDKNKTSTNEEVKIVQKSFSTSKVKLRRQESIDLPDEISDAPILNNIIATGQHKNTNVHGHSGVETVTENNPQFRNPQIPVISISEIPKSDSISENKEKKMFYVSNYQSPLSLRKERETDCLKPEQKTYLNVSTRIKNNYTKLISQKSIEMALANFTNEAQTKLVDLNNISIEDIPETSSIMRENSKVENNEGEGNQIPDNQSRQLIFVQSKPTDIKSSDKEATIDINVPASSQNNSMNNKKNVPVIEINGSVASVDTQKGYELILKWPDGKQIYLKEMNNDSDSLNMDSQSKPVHDNTPTHSITKSVINNSVKRKLKDMIAINGKKTCNTINNQLVLNTLPVQNVVVPAKYIFVPIPDPEFPLVPNDYNIVPPPVKDPQLVPKEINVNTIPQPVIRTVLNGKICEGTKEIFPANNMKKNVRKYVISRDQDMSSNTPSTPNVEEDPIEMKKKGNRAAVLRYRLRGKQKQKNLMEKNEMLEKKNKELSELLKLAYAEINHLRKKLGIKNANSSGNHVENTANRDSSSSVSTDIPKPNPSVIFKKGTI